MDGSEDTDTLLALIRSLLPDNITPSQESLLDALLQTDGDVEKAAEIISKQRLNSKRKRNVSLDSWLIHALLHQTIPTANPHLYRSARVRIA
jgi:hypothetical protein